MMRRRWPTLIWACVITALSSGTLVFGQDEPGDELIQLVIQLLNEEDQDVRALAFEQVRAEAPGEHATRQFAAQLSGLPPETQVGLLRALAERGDPAAREDVLGLLKSPQDAMRSAAIEALGSLGKTADTRSSEGAVEMNGDCSITIPTGMHLSP